MLLGTLAEVFPYPEVLVAGAQHRFEDGPLTDDATAEVVSRMLESCAAWLAVRRPGTA